MKCNICNKEIIATGTATITEFGNYHSECYDESMDEVTSKYKND